jgi:hypothetical protein
MNGMLSLDQSPKGGRDFGLVFNPIFKEEVEKSKKEDPKKTKRSIATSRLELETDIPAVFLAVGEEDLQKENLAKASGRRCPTPES